MSIGPHAEKRPADAIASALHVARPSSGEAAETYIDQAKRAGRRKRAPKRWTPAQRRLIPQHAAAKRWPANMGKSQ